MASKPRKAVQTATGQQVRAWYAADPSRVPEDAPFTLVDRNGNPARGRLKPSAITTYNEGNDEGFVYAEGNVKTVTLPYTQVSPKGRKTKKTVNLPLSDIRTLAGAPEGKGPLSQAALAKAGDAYAASLKG